MKRRIVAFCFVLIFVFSLGAFSVSAANEELLIDEAGLLTAEEQQTLSKQLEEIKAEQNFIVAIVTMESLPEEMSSQEKAEELYDELYGEDSDGCLLLRTLNPRYVYVCTTGTGREIIDPKLEKIFDKIEDDMLDDNYPKAFGKYAKLCNKYVDETYHFPLLRNLLISLAIGFLIALIVVLIMRAQLKSVKAQNLAQEYMKEGSLNVTEARDLYLYSNISKTKIERESSGGSSGGSHGGGGRSM